MQDNNKYSYYFYGKKEVGVILPVLTTICLLVLLVLVQDYSVILFIGFAFAILLITGYGDYVILDGDQLTLKGNHLMLRKKIKMKDLYRLSLVVPFSLNVEPAIEIHYLSSNERNIYQFAIGSTNRFHWRKIVEILIIKNNMIGLDEDLAYELLSQKERQNLIEHNNAFKDKITARQCLSKNWETRLP